MCKKWALACLKCYLQTIRFQYIYIYIYNHNHDQLYKRIIHLHLHMHAHLYAEHNNDTIKTTSDTVLLEKYTSHFIWKGCVWEGVEDRTELQHIDPHSIGHNRVSFRFSWAAQPGTWGPSLSRTCSHSSNFSPTRLIPNCSIRGLRAPSAGFRLSLPHLVSNWSGLQN